MQVSVDTVRGRRTYTIRSLSQIAKILAILQANDEQVERNSIVPPLYSAGITYRREGRVSGNRRIMPVREDWKGTRRLLRDGFGDCEDLAAKRAAELRVSGEDPGAEAVCYSPRPGLVHVLVRRGDGTLEDPSRVLGMGEVGMEDRIKCQNRQNGNGMKVRLSVPLSGSEGDQFQVRAVGAGRTHGAAMRRAVSAEVGALREIGVLPPCEPVEVGAEVPEDVAGAVRSAVAAGDVGAAADALGGAVQAAGGNWQDAAVGIAEGACSAALGSVGLSSLCDLIGPIAAQIKKWATVTVAPERDARDAAKVAVPEFAGPEAHKRFLFLFFGKDKTRRDAIRSLNATKGWHPVNEWERSYGGTVDYGSGKGTYYAMLYDRETAPQALKNEFMQSGARALRWLTVDAATRTREMQEYARSHGSVTMPNLPREVGSKEDIERFRVAGREFGIEVPTTVAADSLLRTNEGFRGIQPLFDMEARETSPIEPSAPIPSGEGKRPAERAAQFKQAAHAATAAAPVGVASQVAAQLANLSAAHEIARDRDWQALRDFASVLERSEPNSVVARIARTMVKR